MNTAQFSNAHYHRTNQAEHNRRKDKERQNDNTLHQLIGHVNQTGIQGCRIRRPGNLQSTIMTLST